MRKVQIMQSCLLEGGIIGVLLLLYPIPLHNCYGRISSKYILFWKFNWCITLSLPCTLLCISVTVNLCNQKITTSFTNLQKLLRDFVNSLITQIHCSISLTLPCTCFYPLYISESVHFHPQVSDLTVDKAKKCGQETGNSHSQQDGINESILQVGNRMHNTHCTGL